MMGTLSLLPLATVLDVNAIGGAALGYLGGLVTTHFIMKRYIRDAVGIKETTKTEVGPQPFVVAAAHEPVNRKEFEALKAENDRVHDNIFSKMGGSERGLGGRIGELEKSVSKLDERTQTTNTNLNLANQKLDRIVERLGTAKS